MSEKKYSHVVVVGIDGAGTFMQNTDTPCIDRIFENGAVTHGALACFPTISAECWGAMLLGVGPEVHKLTNDVVSSKHYPSDAPFPSLFRRIREAMPDAVLGSYCDWNPITYGIVEQDIGVSTDTADDTTLTPIICEYIETQKPTFLFVQSDSVDGAGHCHGYGSENHLKRITEVDLLVNDVYNSIEKAGMLDDTLFMIISDHGGTLEGRSHGGWTDEEKYVTFAITGKGVKKAQIKNMNIRDLAAIVLYAFGIDAPEFDENGWTSQIPPEIWDDSEIPPYRYIPEFPGAEPRVSKEAHTSELL